MVRRLDNEKLPTATISLRVPGFGFPYVVAVSGTYRSQSTPTRSFGTNSSEDQLLMKPPPFSKCYVGNEDSTCTYIYL